MKITSNMIEKLKSCEYLGQGISKATYGLSKSSVLKITKSFPVCIYSREEYKLIEVANLDGDILDHKLYFYSLTEQTGVEFSFYLSRPELRNFLAKIKSSLYAITRGEDIIYFCFVAERLTPVSDFELTYEKNFKKIREMSNYLRDLHSKNVGYRKGTKKLLCLDYGLRPFNLSDYDSYTTWS